MAKFKVGDVIDLSHYGSDYKHLTVVNIFSGSYTLIGATHNPKDWKYCGITDADTNGILVMPVISIGGIYETN